MIDITITSLDLFLAYAKDAGNWSGTPMISGSKAERGNLTQLKRAGLLTTFESDGCTFVSFTEAGRQLAAENSIIITA